MRGREKSQLKLNKRAKILFTGQSCQINLKESVCRKKQFDLNISSLQDSRSKPYAGSLRIMIFKNTKLTKEAENTCKTLFCNALYTRLGIHPPFCTIDFHKVWFEKKIAITDEKLSWFSGRRVSKTIAPFGSVFYPFVISQV